MQIFYLLAGFFTAMMLQRNGLATLLRVRSQRIGIPLVVALVTVVPLIDLASAGAVRPEVAALTAAREAQREGSIPGLYLNLHHLWFLWFLCLYVGAVALVVVGARRVRRRVRLRGSTPARARSVALAILVRCRSSRRSSWWTRRRTVRSARPLQRAAAGRPGLHLRDVLRRPAVVGPQWRRRVARRLAGAALVPDPAPEPAGGPAGRALGDLPRPSGSGCRPRCCR